MEYQPTLKEYLNSKRDEIVIRQNGSFFLVKSNNSKLFRAIKTALSLIFIILIPLLVVLDRTWPNITIDMALLWLWLLRTLNKIEYNNCSFEHIEDNNKDHEKAIDWLRSHAYRNHVMYKLLTGLIIILMIANSFTSLYIRSMVQNQCDISDMSVSFFNCDGDTAIDFENFEDFENFSEVIIPDTTIADIHISTKITGKPDTCQFKINGHVSSDIYCIKNVSFIWDKEIFTQEYFGFFDFDDLPDNSILEISSGSFSRQWTIKLTD